jgi:hydrogenase expression/formation protein HypE
MKARGIVFDFDGTLTHPGAIDFAAIRKKIGCPDGQSIIHWIEAIRDPERRADALDTLLKAEGAAALASVPRDGVEEFLAGLRGQGLPFGILTRNTRASLMAAFGNFVGLRPDWFAPIITREDPFPRKPEPEALIHIAEAWGISPSALLFVGDYRDDVETAHRAGAISCWMMPPGGGLEPTVPPHFRCTTYPELADIVQELL